MGQIETKKGLKISNSEKLSPFLSCHPTFKGKTCRLPAMPSFRFLPKKRAFQ
ncbi:hypothetical protein HMPREF9442_00417 [Paraprevotella xylaniphila YIT 11841]|uniref:Uncharacterized protein n=1 Tax=Paraprevotella xylaniphila YIT 11841 TaxID=762982 RepID=F3QQH5_9BACT|nr:hypothetical protein HMPREF9442_00417 [Paraprevotella xylaniphila YIT 11841]